MTIRNRELSRRLSNLENCVSEAPAGLFERSKSVAALVGDMSNEVLQRARDAGLNARNDDTLRDLEAAIYGYILASNPGDGELMAAEGYGEHR